MRIIVLLKNEWTTSLYYVLHLAQTSSSQYGPTFEQALRDELVCSFLWKYQIIPSKSVYDFSVEYSATVKNETPDETKKRVLQNFMKTIPPGEIAFVEIININKKVKHEVICKKTML